MLTGPLFLYSGEYPIERDTPNVDSTPLDDVDAPPASTALTVSSEHPSALLIERCGYWKKLVGIHKFICMFLAVLKRCVHTIQPDRAELSILKYVHETAFADDYGHLQKNDQVSKSSPLAQLNPFIDSSGLIRLRGRIQNSDVPEAMHTPILLPSKHRVTRLIIEDCHRTLGHSGVKHVISALRKRYWILKCLSTVKSVIGQCIICKKASAPLMTQIMAPLPVDRLTPDEPPFSRIGVDYFGPMQVRVGRSTPKRWGSHIHLL